MSSNTIDSPILRSPRSSHRKVRSPSSLAGMFETESTPPSSEVVSPRRSTMPSFPCNTYPEVSTDDDNNNKYSPADREGLLEMTRKLRQAKRKLFLKSAVQPTDSVERFREILLRISFEEPEFGCPDMQGSHCNRSIRSSSQSSSSNYSLNQE